MLEPRPHPAATVDAPEHVLLVRKAHDDALNSIPEATEGEDDPSLDALARRVVDPEPRGRNIDPQFPIDGTWPTPPIDSTVGVRPAERQFIVAA
jgi:hypothetical protein